MESIGVGLHHGPSPSEIVECAVLAENLGYESVWVAEGYMGDQFSILTACAIATKKVLLGTAISSIFVRSAPTIALAAATVDHFSEGRFILGLGTSHRSQVERQHGLPFSEPVKRLRESMEVVRKLLRDGRASIQGDVFNIQEVSLGLEVQRREIPIYVAAVNPRMLQICGEIAQGAMPIWCTLERARSAAEHAALGARQAGKNPQDVKIAAVVPTAVSTRKESGRERMRGVVASAARLPRYRKLFAESGGYYDEFEALRRAWAEGDGERARGLVPPELIERIAVVGTPE